MNGRVDTVKTEYSADDLPIDPSLVKVLLVWREIAPTTPEQWVFANPATCRPYNGGAIQKRYLRSIGRELQLPHSLGWHMFRHTYRSWLDAIGAPVGVQQKLMRHAQISTKMNFYGNAMMQSKREAHEKVVHMALTPAEGGNRITDPAVGAENTRLTGTAGT